MSRNAFLIVIVGTGTLAAADSALRDFQQRHPADFAEELPDLPSSRRGRADVFPDVQRRPALGQSDESGGGHAEDAALVCRSTGRSFLE